MEDDFLCCAYGLRVSETKGALSSGVRFVVGAKGGGGVVLVNPGWERGEENQRMWGRMGEGRRKAFPGRDPFSVVSIVPPLGDPSVLSHSLPPRGAAQVPPLLNQL